jgi:hypothetical protein
MDRASRLAARQLVPPAFRGQKPSMARHISVVMGVPPLPIVHSLLVKPAALSRVMDCQPLHHRRSIHQHSLQTDLGSTRRERHTIYRMVVASAAPVRQRGMAHILLQSSTPRPRHRNRAMAFPLITISSTVPTHPFPQARPSNRPFPPPNIALRRHRSPTCPRRHL